MYAGADFPQFEDGAARVLGFDLGNLLVSTEGIISVTSALVCTDGTDSPLASNPAGRFIGPPTTAQNFVTQGIVFNDAIGSLVGNEYALGFSVVTTLGKTIMPWARFRLGRGYGAPTVPASAPPPPVFSTFVLPIPPVKIVLSSGGGYAGQDFTEADAGEKWAYGFDLSPALSVGETILSVVFALTLTRGTDTPLSLNPVARFVGAPVISGNTVTQFVAWPPPLPDLRGNHYVLNGTASTSLNQSISTWSRIAISMGM